MVFLNIVKGVKNVFEGAGKTATLLGQLTANFADDLLGVVLIIIYIAVIGICGYTLWKWAKKIFNGNK